MDTDGSVENGTHAIFVSTSNQLVRDVQEIAWSLGAIATIVPQQTHYTYNGVRLSGKPSWRVFIVHPEVSSMFSLPRKVAQCVKKEMRHRLQIISTEPVGKKLAQCIKVDSENGLYVTDNYIVTHNTTSAINRVWHWNGPRVVFDPSLEMEPIMRSGLERLGYEVQSIDLNGNGINILEWIDVGNPVADVHIQSVVRWIYNESALGSGQSDSADKNKFFTDYGKELVRCIIADCLYQPGGPRTLEEIYPLICTPELQMMDLLRGINASSHSRTARLIAGTLMDMRAPETFSGIVANAFIATSWLTITPYSRMVSHASMPTRDVTDPRSVVFIQAPLRTLMTTPSVARAVMGALMNEVFEADGATTLPVLFEIDEAPLFGPMDEFLLTHRTGRKYKAFINQIMLAQSDLFAIWGENLAKTLLNTASWRSYNVVQDLGIAKEISETLGEYGVRAFSTGTNEGTSRPGQPFAWRSTSEGSNLNEHEISKRLITPDRIMFSPADRLFVIARDFWRPIDCVTAPYYRYPHVAAEMALNRFRASNASTRTSTRRPHTNVRNPGTDLAVIPEATFQ